MAEVLDYLHRKAAARKIPLSGTFELSPVCNFSCRMCYLRAGSTPASCTFDSLERRAGEILKSQLAAGKTAGPEAEASKAGTGSRL